MASDIDPHRPIARFEGVELAEADEARPAPRLSFALAPRSFSVLLGPHRSGKTRAIDILSLAGRPVRGVVEVFGRDIARAPPADRPALRRRVGIVFEDHRLVPEFSAFDNIALAARVVGRPPKDYEPKIAELAAWVGLAGRLGEEPRHLSESERRRLCLARALINSPDLLLLDEPVAGLADRSAERFLRLVAEINGAGATVVVATRDRNLAASSGGSVIRLDQGQEP